MSFVYLDYHFISKQLVCHTSAVSILFYVKSNRKSTRFLWIAGKSTYDPEQFHADCRPSIEASVHLDKSSTKFYCELLLDGYVRRNIASVASVLPESPLPVFCPFVDFEQITDESKMPCKASSICESQEIASKIPWRTIPSVFTSSTFAPLPITRTASDLLMSSQVWDNFVGRMVWLNWIGCGNSMRPIWVQLEAQWMRKLHEQLKKPPKNHRSLPKKYWKVKKAKDAIK